MNYFIRIAGKVREVWPVTKPDAFGNVTVTIADTGELAIVHTSAIILDY